MDFLQTILDITFNLDEYLADMITVYKNWIYLILFLIVFFENGIIFAAFLPGDSLLFVAGTLSAIPANHINVHLVAFLFIIAAILGYRVNFMIGKRFGQRIIENAYSGLVKRKHLEQTHLFYKRYGGMTLVLARFIPFVRTFAPFMAGMSRMPHSRFVSYNVTGGLVWVLLLVYLGFFLGTFEVVQNNMTWFIILLILLANTPAAIQIIRRRIRKEVRK